MDIKRLARKYRMSVRDAEQKYDLAVDTAKQIMRNPDDDLIMKIFGDLVESKEKNMDKANKIILKAGQEIKDEAGNTYHIEEGDSLINMKEDKLEESAPTYMIGFEISTNIAETGEEADQIENDALDYIKQFYDIDLRRHNSVWSHDGNGLWIEYPRSLERYEIQNIVDGLEYIDDGLWYNSDILTHIYVFDAEDDSRPTDDDLEQQWYYAIEVRNMHTGIHEIYPYVDEDDTKPLIKLFNDMYNNMDRGADEVVIQGFWDEIESYLDIKYNPPFEVNFRDKDKNDVYDTGDGKYEIMNDNVYDIY